MQRIRALGGSEALGGQDERTGSQVSAEGGAEGAKHERNPTVNRGGDAAHNEELRKLLSACENACRRLEVREMAGARQHDQLRSLGRRGNPLAVGARRQHIFPADHDQHREPQPRQIGRRIRSAHQRVNGVVHALDRVALDHRCGRRRAARPSAAASLSNFGIMLSATAPTPRSRTSADIRRRLSRPSGRVRLRLGVGENRGR